MKEGDTVVLLGLKAKQLNSKLATIVRKNDVHSWFVRLNESALSIGVRNDIHNPTRSNVDL